MTENRIAYLRPDQIRSRLWPRSRACLAASGRTMFWKASIWGGFRQKLVSFVVISTKRRFSSAGPWLP